MKPVDVDCPHCDQSLSVERDQIEFDIECPTCGKEFLIENDVSDDKKELNKSLPKKFNLNQSSKSNSKKPNKNRNDKFVIENWMIYLGYYLLLIGIPLLLIIFGSVFASESVASIGGPLLFFGCLNLANSFALFIGLRVTKVNCEVSALILTSFIWALWETFVGTGGNFVFLFLFKHFTDGEIFWSGILTLIITWIVQVILVLTVLGLIIGLLSSLGLAEGL